MSEGIIVGIFGLLGIIIGSFITVFSQLFFEKKKESREHKNECIKNLNIIPQKLTKLMYILDKIINFMKTDLEKIDNEEYADLNDEMLNFYNDKFPYFWDSFIKELYILLPHTSKTLGFQILDNVINETENISDDIRDYLENYNDTISGWKDLQFSFNQSFKEYVCAKYTVYKLQNEYYSTISKNALIKREMKAFYKKNKKLIKLSLKK